MGLDTRAKFYQLGLDAESIEGGEHALKQLAELMHNCIACHATYRLETDESN